MNRRAHGFGLVQGGLSTANARFHSARSSVVLVATNGGRAKLSPLSTICRLYDEILLRGRIAQATVSVLEEEGEHFSERQKREALTAYVAAFELAGWLM